MVNNIFFAKTIRFKAKNFEMKRQYGFLHDHNLTIKIGLHVKITTIVISNFLYDFDASFQF